MFRPVLSLAVASFLVATTHAAEVDRYLLDDTDAVLGINVKMLVEAPLVKKHYLPVVQKQLQGNAEVQKQLKELGFDPLKDVERVLLVHGDSCHRTVAGKEEFAPFVIVHGKFDAAKIQAKIAQLAQFAPQLLKIHKGASGAVYEFAGEKSVFFAMPDRATLVASLYKDQVGDALDKGLKKKETKLKTFGMQFLIEQTDYKNGAWVAASGRAALTRETPLPTAKGKKVEKEARKKLSDSGIYELSGGVSVSDGVKAAFRVKVEDPETAKTISDVLQQFLPEAASKGFDGKLDGKQFSPVREFLRTLIVASEDNDLIIRGDVAGKVFGDSLK